MTHFTRFTQKRIRRPRGSTRAIVPALLLFLWPGVGDEPARAEPGRLELGARVAPSWETHAGEREAAENTYKRGWSAGLALRYGLMDSLSIQAELLHATRGSDVTADGETINAFNFRYIQIPVLAQYEFPIPGLAGDGQRSTLAGYLLAGPAFSILARAEDVDDGRFLDRADVGSFDVSATVGVGVAWRIASRSAVSFEVRFDRGFFNTFPNTTGLDTKNQAILLTLGFDHSLMHDEDSDGDGLLDARDQCRTTAEDRNGYRDADGCPDADEDQDEVAFEDDRCRDKAEDKDGFEDEDGCPDPDNDGDQILDDEDKCRDEPFPHNKALENDWRGCPPRFERVRVEPDRLVLEPPLVFAWKRAELGVDNQRTLDEVAELLTHYYPNMRLRLEGHADVRGAASYNVPLTRRRAEAVLRYLVDIKKIPEERLSVLARGADRPEYSADEEKGMERNRRVDLIVIAK